jgi:hypothetical protein
MQSTATKKDVSIPTTPPVVREHKIEGKSYMVKRIFIGNKDIKATILKIAEQRTLKEMGMDTSFS